MAESSGEPPPPSPPGPDEGGRELRPDPLVGKTLAERYHLTRKIGEGGMGAVYEARHKTLDRALAVKVLRDKYLDRTSVAQRMRFKLRDGLSVVIEGGIDVYEPQGRYSLIGQKIEPVGEGGRRMVHGRDFREAERRFPGYQRARDWEKAHLHVLLRHRG